MNIANANSQTKNGYNEHPSIVFLKALFKSCHQGFINLRFFPSETNLFVPVNDITSIASILEAHHHEDAYFAVATRTEGDGSKQEILELPALWVNLDFKSLPQEKKQEIRERYRDFPLRSSFVVLTKGEIYIFWLLKKPVSSEKIPVVENLLNRLASYFGDDSGLADVSGILRIPGTLNYEYSPPCEVILDVFFPKNRHSLSDFDFLLPTETSTEEDKDLELADEDESTGENISPKPQDRSLLPPPNPHESNDPKEWIRLLREIENSVIFRNEGLLKVWVWCLMRANRENRWLSVTTGRGTTEVFVEREQFLFQRKKAAKALKMDENTLYKRMKKLRDMGNLDIQSKAHYSLVTIANRDDCGSFHEKSNTQSKTKGTPN